MSLKVTINGMGIVGRELLKAICCKTPDLEVAAINDPYTSADQLKYFLEHDTIYHNRGYTFQISNTSEDVAITINGKEILMFHEVDISNLPFGGIGSDTVFDCRGVKLLSAEALSDVKHVINVAPANLGDGTAPIFVYGVNHKAYKPEDATIVIPSIETHVLSILARVLHDEFGAREGMSTAITGYTNSGTMMDSYNRTINAGRAGAFNIIPWGSGYAKHVGKVVNEVNGVLYGFMYHVPTIAGGMLEFHCRVDMIIDRDMVLNSFKKLLEWNEYGECMAFTEDPLVSSDALGLEKAQFIAPETAVLGQNFVKVCAVYDNIRGLVRQAIRMAQYMATVV